MTCDVHNKEINSQCAELLVRSLYILLLCILYIIYVYTVYYICISDMRPLYILLLCILYIIYVYTVFIIVKPEPDTLSQVSIRRCIMLTYNSLENIK